jgi:hypothetical protein
VLPKSERRGDVGRVRRENAQRAGGGAEETPGETLAAVGGEYTESEHVHLDRGRCGHARGQIRGEGQLLCACLRMAKSRSERGGSGT